jgi:hypothetical protein
MALIDKKSKLDRNYRNNEGPNVGESLPQDGQYFTNKGTSDSPFQSKDGDHMISLLKNSTVYSTGDEAALTGLTYKSAPNDVIGKEQDLNGSDPSTLPAPGGPTYFNGYGKGGKHQGKKLGGLDLHEALLQQAYTYNHGEGTSTTVLGENERGHEGGALDLDKADGGQGYFHGKGINNPGIGQGKKLKGEDLHETLLDNSYTYKHGNSKANILLYKDTSPGGIYDLNGNDPGNTPGGPLFFDSGVPSQVHGNPLESPDYTQLVKIYNSKVHNISDPYPFSGDYGPVGSETRFQDLDGKDYGGNFPGNRRYEHPETGTLY